MGYYIETPQPKNKVAQLMGEFADIQRVAPSERMLFDFTGQTIHACVVDNGPFEAVAVAYDVNEMDAFRDTSDYRPKTWLRVPRATLEKLIAMGRCPSGVISRLPNPKLPSPSMP